MGAWGHNCRDGSYHDMQRRIADGIIGMGSWGRESGEGRVGTGAFGYHRNGSIMTCRGGLGQFFLSVILKFSSSFIFFFLLRSLKKFTEEE